MRVWLPAIRSGTGTDVFTERLAKALVERGIDATITWFPRIYEFLPEMMRFTSPPADTDIIHVNAWAAVAFLGRGIPVVTTVHHLVHDPAFAPYRSRAQALYHRWHLRHRDARAIRQSAAVTAVTPYVAATVSGLFARQDVRVVSNWVDTSIYRPAEDESLREAGAPLRVLWVGNPSRRKGADLLPRLASMLGERAVISCVGGLRGDMAVVEGSERLVWLGRLNEADLVRAYQQCDVLISLSRYEGFGYTALEAMACGKPVVAFAAGGLVDVVAHSVTGLLSPVDDINSIVADILSIADDWSFSQRLGRAARDAALAQPHPVDDYVRIYSGEALSQAEQAYRHREIQ